MIKRVAPRPGQESVWDYPRPPRLEPTPRRLRVVFAGVTIADTLQGYRVLETSHPPVYYIPPADVKLEHLQPARGSSFCEFKGQASYYDVVVGDRRAERAAWYYPRPTPAFAPIAGAVAFYAGPMDACYVGDEAVTPQPGDFYGGWITADVVGPFKGGPRTTGWGAAAATPPPRPSDGGSSALPSITPRARPPDVIPAASLTGARSPGGTSDTSPRP